MPDEIRPALSAEEWAAERKTDPVTGSAVYLDRAPGGVVHFVVHSHDTWRGEPYTGAWRLYGSRPAAVMALANAALPDGDRRKLTHAHVAAIGRVLDILDSADVMLIGGDPDDEQNDPRDIALVGQLREIVAALLPPSEEGR